MLTTEHRGMINSLVNAVMLSMHLRYEDGAYIYSRMLARFILGPFDNRIE